jgi:hypothetical protein
MSAFDRLLLQIDAFIRKYYKHEMLKGLLVFVGFLFASWLVVAVLEFFGRFSSGVRFFLFWTFILGNAVILGKFFVFPVLKLFTFGERINRNQAAKIIGDFFPNISDRLLNTLQLNESANPNDRSFELIRASVVQRANELTVVPFTDAVRVDAIKKRAKYVIPVLLVFFAVLAFAPRLIVDGSSQVMNYNAPQRAPFTFTLSNNDLVIQEGENLKIRTAVSGDYVPEKIYLVLPSGKFLMTRDSKTEVVHELENVRESFEFYFESEGYRSKTWQVQVLGKSALGSLEASLVYPAYLHRKNEVVSNIAELELPEGTTVNWNLSAKHVGSLKVLNGMFSQWFTGSKAAFSTKHTDNGLLQFVMKNSYTNYLDTNQVQIKVVKDAYPSILVNESVDSINPAVRLFSGLVSDDHGLTALQFSYTITQKDGKQRTRKMFVDRFKSSNADFQFAVDFGRENLSIEDKISYHFTIFDNDGVNGSKATVSQTFVYELPNLEELNEMRDEDQQQVQQSLADILKRTEQFQKDVNRLQKNLGTKSKADFKALEQVQQLKQEQQSLQQDLQELQEKLEQSNDMNEQLSEQDEELLKQQELIEELLKEVMDDELKELLDQLEEMMRKNDQFQMNNKSEDLKESTESMKNQMDRALEMLKRLQVNEKIDAIEKELDELAKEQEELKEQIEKDQLSKGAAEKKQDEINKKFDDLKKDLKEMQELNKSLDRPMQLDELKEMQESISEDLNGAKENVSKGKNSKAGQQQKSASEKMKEMSDQLNNQQEQSNQKQAEEDMGLIRMLLENLMTLSFDQERNLQAFAKVKDNDPLYRRLGRKQRAIIDDSKPVEDSLIALAKRQPKVAAFIDKELKEIRSNYGYVIDEIDEHRRRELTQHQQLVMTSYNNLALLLNESLQSMQQQAQSKQSGSGSCENPGGSGKKPSSGKEGEMGTEDMKEMLRKQLEQMKKGPNPGGKQPGNQPGQGNQGMPGLGNKEIAKMAAQQTAIRQRLEQLRNEMNKEGQGKGNQLNPLIKELEQQERDLINKKFSPEMIRRQQEILTRLLESEKAIKERGFEEKRESKSGNNQNNSNLIRFDEYTRLKQGQVDLLKTVDPVLAPYYKNKANQYFNRSVQ